MNENWSNHRLSEEERHIFELLSEETRHLIVQFVLAHPKYLISLTELDYAIPKSRSEIRDQLDTLIEVGILDRYCSESNEIEEDLPSEFYGPTEHGVEILYEFKYLRAVPILRTLYRNTEKPPEMERYETATRPDLSEPVSARLSIDDDSTETGELAES